MRRQAHGLGQVGMHLRGTHHRPRAPSQVMTDVAGNPEEERRAELYHQPWSQEAVSRYFYCKVMEAQEPEAPSPSVLAALPLTWPQLPVHHPTPPCSSLLVPRLFQGRGARMGYPWSLTRITVTLPRSHFL